MIFILLLMILVSVYVASNEKLQNESRTGWFAVSGLFLVAYIVFGIVLS